MALSKTVPEPYDISIQSTIIQMRSFPTISSLVTAVVDTFANENEGSGTSVDVLEFLEKLTNAI